jgi:hypothetical protein
MPSSPGDVSHGAGETSDPRSPGYETSDANTDAVLGFMVGLLLVLVLTLLATWGLFRYFSVAEREPAPASSFAGVRQLPAAPQLEVYPRVDLLETLAKQQQELETYSWEDRSTGTVRIPIERAMDLLLQKGLPVLPSGGGQQAAKGHSIPKSLAHGAGGSVASAEGSRGND